MDQPLISIVLTTYNSENTIRDVLDSIVKQDFPLDKVELVIVDGGSRDETLEIVRRFMEERGSIFHNTKLVVHEKNYGVSRARNDGIRASSGRYVLILDHDVIMEKSTLTNLYRFLESSPRRVAAVIPLHVNYPENTLTRWERLIREGRITRASAITSCALIRRKAIEKIGFYDETLGPPFTIAEDTEYYARAKKMGYIVLILGFEKVLHVDETIWGNMEKHQQAGEEKKVLELLNILRTVFNAFKSIRSPPYRYAYKKYVASLPLHDRIKWYCYGFTLITALLATFVYILSSLGAHVLAPAVKPLALASLLACLALYVDVVREYWNLRVFHISLAYSAIALTWRMLRSLMLLMP